ncbi:DUF2167 domain-containing protein [Pseudaeromonas sharmana]|uniref:DUF2167 domain-containing protein n=1 Tax=Pseudaeromonas sharmana TaxID=328412 RepID=A0ABV8CMM7_9GAMM
MIIRTGWQRTRCLVLGLALTLPVQAEEPDAMAAAQAEYEAANIAAMQAAVAGPTDITINDQAHLQLPEGMAFIPKQQTQRLLQAIDGQGDSAVEGTIIPQSEDENWMLLVSYEKTGFIRDDDAKEWDPDGMLDSLKEGTEAANEERRQRGIPELEVLGWAEVPAYDSAQHQLRWSASARQKGSVDSNYTINYKTLALGREGYIGMNLITDMENVDRLKPLASQLINGIAYNDGKHYSDFSEETDQVAEYGLAALVAGVAAKKLGFFALAAAFFAKFAKVIFIAVAAGGATLGKLFRRK